MKPSAHLFNLFEKNSMILHLFLKAKSQAYIIKTFGCSLRKRKGGKKTVKIKIGKSFLELTCFIFHLSFKPIVLRFAILFVACFLFMICEKQSLRSIC